MKLLLTLFITLFFSQNLLGQTSEIEVADLSVKIPSLGNQEYYYGFEAGDELIFNYLENNNKELKLVEIIEYPDIVKYSGAQIAKISKRLKVNKRGVYVFKFTNNSISARNCKFKITRIPSGSDAANFNTSIKWNQIADTTFSIINKKEIARYDTTYKTVNKKELIKVDTIGIELFSKTEQVAAQTTIGRPSESIIPITLPENKITKLETQELVSWAYWIGVGQEGHLAFEANKQIYLQAAGSIAKFTGNPVIGLALNQIAFLPTGNSGSNVAYFFLPTIEDARILVNNYDNGGFRAFDRGNGVSGNSRKELPKQGTFYLGLHNDNVYNQINVTVKVAAVIVRKQYIEKQYQEPIITPQYVNRIIKQPIVTIKKVPVTMN